MSLLTWREKRLLMMIVLLLLILLMHISGPGEDRSNVELLNQYGQYYVFQYKLAKVPGKPGYEMKHWKLITYPELSLLYPPPQKPPRKAPTPVRA